MRLLLSFFLIIIFPISYGQELRPTKQNLVGELIKHGGTLSIRIRYVIGEKPYDEQHIFIRKHGSNLLSTILIDSGSYFVTYKNFCWTDTMFTIQTKEFDNLIKLEKTLFKKGLTPTYNCDGKNGRLIHNQTNVFFVYNPDTTFTISRNLIDSTDLFYKGFRSKKSKFKLINVGGGFVSFKDELINPGIPFDKCKTYWWDK